jgi:hypothetical protein
LLGLITVAVFGAVQKCVFRLLVEVATHIALEITISIEFLVGHSKNRLKKRAKLAENKSAKMDAV